MKQFYQNFKFQRDTRALINTINEIVDDYSDQGFVLTVRQLYYQLVTKNIVPNTEKSYKRVTSIVNDGRLAGLIDWDAIEDRTREFVRRPNWASGGDILEGCAKQFHMDMWENQEMRPVIIIEKEALAGVFDKVSREYDVHLLAARGYPSGTVLREFAKHVMLPNSHQRFEFLHFGDHDPSGIDMSRDLRERIDLFAEGMVDFNFERVALNMDQIDEQQPPPNPAKSTDARFQSYYEQYGSESWELDALKPEYLIDLVRTNIEPLIDEEKWGERKEEIADVRKRIAKIAEEF